MTHASLHLRPIALILFSAFALAGCWNMEPRPTHDLIAHADELEAHANAFPAEYAAVVGARREYNRAVNAGDQSGMKKALADLAAAEDAMDAKVRGGK